MIPDTQDFEKALDALPTGTSIGRYDGQRYAATKTLFNNGQSVKLVAEALSGADYISLNFYKLASGPRLFPCEMAASKVIAFVIDYCPDQVVE